MAELRPPLDPFPYQRDRRSCRIRVGLDDGLYVYVQDQVGVVWVLPDGPHLHPKVLGNAEPAAYAGDLTIRGKVIHDITNLSGTFQFDNPQGLIAVAQCLVQLGFSIVRDGIRYFPIDGSRPYVVDLPGDAQANQ